MKSLLILTVCLPLVLFSLPGFGADYTVVVDGMKYDPSELTVKSGDKITWVNKDFYPHTVTAIKKSFNSKNIPSNMSWSYSPETKGEFDYKCSFHPTMKGRLVVE